MNEINVYKLKVPPFLLDYFVNRLGCMHPNMDSPTWIWALTEKMKHLCKSQVLDF